MKGEGMARRIHDLVMACRWNGKGDYRFTAAELDVVLTVAGIEDSSRPGLGVPCDDFWTFWKAGKTYLRNSGVSVFMSRTPEGVEKDWVVKYTPVRNTYPRSPPGFVLPDDEGERPLW